MSKSLDAIYGRMLSSEEFTFQSLHSFLPDDAYRLADRTLQSFRKREYATFRREGRKVIWSLTDNGKEFLKALVE